jgi:hypothetical protein
MLWSRATVVGILSIFCTCSTIDMKSCLEYSNTVTSRSSGLIVSPLDSFGNVPALIVDLNRA